MNNKGGDSKTKEKFERKKKIEDDTFVAPDGGWGWMVVLAAGFANFCIFPVVQNFGLLFRDKFVELDIDPSQTTTIINVNGAVTACIGLANGPLFRTFTYRQISFAGGLICAVSISALSEMKSFGGVLLFFSILYGAGTGIAGSANSLALNTYFKMKRRIATGFSWTCTGLGPIIMPQVITLLLPIFGMEGTVLIFGGFTFNAIVCALLLQPVSWHVKKKIVTTGAEGEKTDESGDALLNNSESKSMENVQGGRKLSTENRFSSRFGSQYLYYDDEEQGASGLDVLGPDTPMMSRANDGWYSRQSIAASNTSLASNKTFKRENSQKNLSRYPSLSLSRQSSWKALSRGPSLRNLNKQLSSDNETGKNVTEKSSKRKLSTLPSAINSPLIKVTELCEHPEEECFNDNCQNEECMKKKLTQIFRIRIDSTSVGPIAEVNEPKDDEEPPSEDPEEPFYRRFFKAVVIFFDLNLLKDLSYVNLTMGITSANFAEINFSLLTPFILSDYGFERGEVALVMSILAGCDVFTRLAIPFISEWIGWQNKFLFLLGVCMMGTGRMVMAYSQNYIVILILSVWIGIGKAFKTVFMTLVIPSHVPLSRLPAASGLQLLVSGTVYLMLGPLVGKVRSLTTDYSLVLQCLNIFTAVTVISWVGESWYLNRKEKKKLLDKENKNQDVEKS